MYELDIVITENLNLHFIQSESIANIFLNTKHKNLLTKSADIMTFRGLLNCLAFFSQSDHYAIEEGGTILYSDIINIDSELYLQLEDSLEYYDELEDDIFKDYDNGYQVTLYSRSELYENDLEIASFDLDNQLIQLFNEIRDYLTNDLYKHKMTQIEDKRIRI